MTAVAKAKPKISAVLCTHNPTTASINRVFRSLAAQDLPPEEWELIIVDNASREPLAFDLDWQKNAVCVQEQRLGLTFARATGIQAASAELIVFVDDDNLLDTSYFKEAYRIATEWPQLAVWGGAIYPEFEVPPDAELEAYAWRLLALRDPKLPCWSNVPTCSEAQPFGAGMCVRQAIGLAYVQYMNDCDLILIDRQGDQMVGLGDADICRFACKQGVGTGVFPSLKLIHIIPRHRTTKHYLLRANEQLTYALHLSRFKWDGVIPEKGASIKPLARLMFHSIVANRTRRSFFLGSVKSSWRARREILRMRIGPKMDEVNRS
jgi:glycosyltransferase involved in cell wall biosynthesis